MRFLYGTANSSAASVVKQLNTDSVLEVFSITVKARISNPANMYFGFDTAVSSAAGWEMSAGDVQAIDMPSGSDRRSVKPNIFYTISSDTSAKLDWMMQVEN